jgi:hypothetical protein
MSVPCALGPRQLASPCVCQFRSPAAAPLWRRCRLALPARHRTKSVWLRQTDFNPIFRYVEAPSTEVWRMQRLQTSTPRSGVWRFVIGWSLTHTPFSAEVLMGFVICIDERMQRSEHSMSSSGGVPGRVRPGAQAHNALRRLALRHPTTQPGNRPAGLPAAPTNPAPDSKTQGHWLCGLLHVVCCMLPRPSPGSELPIAWLFC